MAITNLQRAICRIIAANRVNSGESYMAGGVALNYMIQAPRTSRDIDLFHDTQQALLASWDNDRALLSAHGFRVEVLRERPAFVEAVISKDDERILMQWSCDSAFRFFPLVQHDDLGLTLHPFDLATNKVLALVGRLEARDWVDLIYCHDRIQKTGYLMWAACGKDPGFSPAFILSEARKSGHYTPAELDTLSFEGPPPDCQALSRSWRAMLEEAQAIMELLPPERAGCCVLAEDNRLFQGGVDALREALRRRQLRFHAGRIKGAFPTFTVM